MCIIYKLKIILKRHTHVREKSSIKLMFSFFTTATAAGLVWTSTPVSVTMPTYS